MEYVVISKGKNSRRLIPLNENIQNLIKDREKDYYKSIFIFDENHKKIVDETNSFKGIRNVSTNILLWDFDDVDNLELPKQDVIKLCDRLENYSISSDKIQIYFSGNKGFHVELKINKRITQQEFKSITFNLAHDLKTYDSRINDPNRIIRLEFTKHEKTGLYKIPISLNELKNSSPEEIKEKAKFLDETDCFLFKNEETELPNKLYILKDESTKRSLDCSQIYFQDIKEIDFHQKVKGITNCKWAIMNGFYDEGQRHEALIALAATLRAQKYPKEIAYNMLKAAERMRVERSDGDLFPKTEIWNNIINSVYSDGWLGGQYSCKDPGKLQEICLSLGDKSCLNESSKEKKLYIQSNEMFDGFKTFAINIDKNTIKTGLPLIDKDLRITTSTLNGILGSPASGKTSLLLNILSHTSKHNIPSIMYSLDMGAPILFQKIIHRVTGMNDKKIYELFKKNEKKEMDELKEKINGEFKNVHFDFKSGQLIDDIYDNIVRYQDETGIKVKLVAIDYLECLNSKISDNFASLNYISHKLKDLKNELDVCVLLLLQPQKAAGDVSNPLFSLRQVKGPSSLEQNMDMLLGIYREGYHPKYPDKDKFLTINILKNRIGMYNSYDFYWDGLRGMIRQATMEELQELEKIRKIKREKAQSMNIFD